MTILDRFIFLIFVFAIVHCDSQWIRYRKGNVILLPNDSEKIKKFNSQENKYEIAHEGSDHSDYLIFQYDSVSDWYSVFTKLWSSVEVTIHAAEDDEFMMKVASTIEELTDADKPHKHATGYEYLQRAFNNFKDGVQNFWNALSYFIFYQNNTNVVLNPIDQHFVQVCYHGSKPSTAFTVTVMDIAIEGKFPVYLIVGVLMLIFVHPISRKVNSLYRLYTGVLGLICFPFTSVYMISRLFPWMIVSYGMFLVGWVSLAFIIYHLTLEQLLQLPLVTFVVILCVAAFVEHKLKPISVFWHTSEKLLGDAQFVWALHILAVLMLLCSTQSCVVSLILLTITYITIESVSKKTKKLKRKLSSQELERVTVAS